MTRYHFSENVMRENAALGMSVEDFAEAVNLPVKTILARCEEYGIVMARRGPPVFLIAQNVRKATSADRYNIPTHYWDQKLSNEIERSRQKLAYEAWKQISRPKPNNSPLT